MSILIKNIILNNKKRDVFIEGKKIVKIGQNLNLRADEKIDGQGKKAILPGLINCHTHAPMILFRGLGEDLPLKDWLEKEIWPRERKLTEDDVYWGAKIALLELIKTGTTTFNEMYFYPEVEIEAVREMGLRAVIGLVIVDFSLLGCTKENAQRIYQKLKDKLPSTIKFSLSPHAIYTVSKENLIWAKKFAKKENLILHMHLSETEWEVKNCLKKWKMRPVEFLEKIGLLGKNSLFAHSIWLTEKEIKILEKRKCSLVYNPCSNMKLASGIFPWQKIKGRKINVCLGSDGPASNNSLDLFEEMKFASLLQKINSMDPAIISASDVFQMATENGAKALKIDSGKVEIGKLADLILIDLDKIQIFPGYNLISNLVYASGGSLVSDLICDGKILMRDGKIEDEDKIKKEAQKRFKRLKTSY